jgi:uncharacterized protein YjiK
MRSTSVLGVAAAAAVAAFAGCLAKRPAPPEPPPPPASLDLHEYRAEGEPVEVEGVFDNLSGLAYSPATGTLFAVLNGPSVLLELTTAGEVLRTIDLGLGDTEGVEILPSGELAVLEERSAAIHFVKIEGEAFEVTGTVAVDPALPHSNLGPEGIAYDPARRCLYACKEKEPLQLYRVPLPGPDEAGEAAAGERLFVIPGMTDAAGLHFDAATGHLVVLSDETACLVELTLEGEEVSRLDGLGTPQAEGVTMDGSGAVYVVSEPNLFYVFRRRSPGGG